VRASRVTFVGELGWELYIATEYATGVFDAIVAVGDKFGLKHAGYHALNSMRTEKGYRHWSHDISPDDSPIEAGLGFTVAWNKEGGFIGRDALQKQKQEGLKQRLVQFLLKSPEPMLYHNEPIWQGERIAGYIRSGMYAQTLGAACGLGYVTAADGGIVGPVEVDDYEIEIAGVRYPATASLKPLFDPNNARIKI
jgi:4-methylaminobutanoate oxidase (formaldehyde-forming)